MIWWFPCFKVVLWLPSCVKNIVVKVFKMSEKYLVYSSGVSDKAKVTESILICLMAAWSSERGSHLVLADSFSGNNFFFLFFSLFQKHLSTNDEWDVHNQLYFCYAFPKCFPWWHFIHQRVRSEQLLDQFSDTSSVVFILHRLSVNLVICLQLHYKQSSFFPQFSLFNATYQQYYYVDVLCCF